MVGFGSEPRRLEEGWWCVVSVKTGLTFPALRGVQGDRVMYHLLVENSVLNNFFTVNMDPPDERSQRQLDPRHAHDIARYLVENPSDYCLGAIIYAVDRDCYFEPTGQEESLGLLTIPLGTNLRSLDGQHRRKGLNEAIEEDPKLSQDHTAIVVYVEPDVSKRRQMFSDMNATPKVVAKALNVRFDSRDPFARAAQRLAADHPFLKGVVELESSRVAAGSDKWYTLGSVWESLKRLQVGPTGRVRNAAQYSEDAIYERGVQLFGTLAEARPEFTRARNGTSVDALRSRSILFSSTTLRALAGAFWIRLREDGSDRSLLSYARALERIDFSPAARLWSETGFISPGKTTPNARNQEVLAATAAVAEALRIKT